MITKVKEYLSFFFFCFFLFTLETLLFLKKDLISFNLSIYWLVPFSFSFLPYRVTLMHLVLLVNTNVNTLVDEFSHIIISPDFPREPIGKKVKYEFLLLCNPILYTIRIFETAKIQNRERQRTQFCKIWSMQNF